VNEAVAGRARGELEIGPHHIAPNGYLHAGAVVGLADTICGYGCIASLPDGASGFTTVELKTNFLGTALEGTLSAEATLVHGGRTTQVWDAIVRADGRTLALFRCTQLVLYPRD
jgi:1,4-dihydroxy-2-naphthoyl-CoA hydrolase